MKGFICDGCGAHIKENKKPSACPICHKTKFSEHEFPNPNDHDKEAKKKYDEALETLEKYEEGTPPRHHETCCGQCGKQD